MSTLTIRNLSDKVHAALRMQAAQDGLSLEAEVRKILTEAAKVNKKPASGLQGLVDNLYAGHKPQNVVDELLKERRAETQQE